MSYYPIFLELTRKPCLVAGGGKVAAQKVKGLLACGARVKVVSPTLSVPLKRLRSAKRIRWRKGVFNPKDLKGIELVVAATPLEEFNERVFVLAQRRRIWVNVVDQPARCSFIVPSVVRRGRLVLAISTGGSSPALAKWIRQDLEKRYGPAYAKLLQKAAGMRRRVRKKVPRQTQRRRLYERAISAYVKVLEKEMK